MGGKGWCSLILTDISYNGKNKINMELKTPWLISVAMS